MKLTAAAWNKSTAYFFKGSDYIRYDIHDDRADDDYPRAIAGNWGVPSSFAKDWDAVAVWNNGKAYIFKGSNYLSYDIASDKTDAGYPKGISGNWKGFPASFVNGIDACVVWNNGKAYFFKGDHYLKFDIASGKVESGPGPIAGNWHGFPVSFAAGVDAAVNWGNGKAYFFKGSEYLRYDIAMDKVDPNYPRPVAGNWPGLIGGDFGAPDIVINYRQPANFYVFKNGNTTTTPGLNGLFMIYEIDSVANNPVFGANAGAFNFSLQQLSVNKADEHSGNTSLDPYLKSAPDQKVVGPAQTATKLGTFVVAVAGDPAALKTSKRHLHYRGPSGISVLVQAGKGTPAFDDPMTPEKAASYKSGKL